MFSDLSHIKQSATARKDPESSHLLNDSPSMISSATTITSVLLLLLALTELNGTVFASGAASVTSPVKNDPKSKYPFKWSKDNGSFSIVPKSEEEQEIDYGKFPRKGGFIRKLFKKEKKYVFYVRNEHDELHAKMVLSKGVDGHEKKENMLIVKLWKVPIKWVNVIETPFIKTTYKIAPGDTKQIVMTAKDKDVYLSMWISYDKPGSLWDFLKDEKGLYFNVAKNVALDMSNMNYALRKKQFKHTGSPLFKYSNIRGRFEAKK